MQLKVNDPHSSNSHPALPPQKAQEEVGVPAYDIPGQASNDPSPRYTLLPFAFDFERPRELRVHSAVVVGNLRLQPSVPQDRIEG